MNENIIWVEDISKSFSGVQALNGLSLSIKGGEVRTLIGENGSGKSTLIKIISGVYKKDSGRIFINGQEFRQFEPLRAIREGIQVIYQELSLLPNLSVAENITIADELARGRRFVHWKDMYKQASKVVDQLQLNVDLRTNVGNLSVAKKQMVAICRALVRNANLIIMDEPTASLTRKEINQLFDVIRELKKVGISTLFVTHKMNEVLEISDSITIIRNGEKVAEGSESEFDLSDLKYHLAGRELSEENRFSYRKEDKGQPLLEVEGLSKQEKFSNVNFELYPGEIIGVTGLLGSGRRDLALALYGVSSADQGTIYVAGEPVTITSPQNAIEHGVGYLPENRLEEGLAMDKSVSENIICPIIEDLLNRLKLVHSGKTMRTSKEWIGKLNIKTSSSSAPARSLSGGNQQKVVLAKILATMPKVLVLNLPTFGIDVGTRMKIHKLLRQHAYDEEKGIIIISDDVPELVNNCNRILLMRDGQIKEEFSQKNISIKDLYNHLISDAM